MTSKVAESKDIPFANQDSFLPIDALPAIVPGLENDEFAPQGMLPSVSPAPLLRLGKAKERREEANVSTSRRLHDMPRESQCTLMAKFSQPLFETCSIHITMLSTDRMCLPLKIVFQGSQK